MKDFWINYLGRFVINGKLTRIWEVRIQPAPGKGMLVITGELRHIATIIANLNAELDEIPIVLRPWEAKKG